jgi:hypothetical protein
MMGEQAASGQPNPLAEEALRLLGAVQDWARRTMPPPQGEQPAECQWCPLCQFAAVLRGERPEVTAKLTEAGVALAGALRSIADAAAGAGHTGQHRHDPPGTSEPRVQPIRLVDPDPFDDPGRHGDEGW